MMMPANFSVVAENEMTYVVGGGVIEAIGSVTAPVWNAANVKTFNTNLVTIVGNTFTQALVATTLGTMFGGNWGGDDGAHLFGDKGTLSLLVKNTVKNGKVVEKNTFNKFMTVLGLGAAVYQLGTTEAKSYVGSAKVITSDSKPVKF